MILRGLKYPLSNYLFYLFVVLIRWCGPVGIAFWPESHFFVVARCFHRARNRFSGVSAEYLLRSFSLKLLANPYNELDIYPDFSPWIPSSQIFAQLYVLKK